MSLARLTRMLGFVVLLCAVVFCTTPSSSGSEGGGYSATDDHAVSLVQLVFISCSRHDYYQTYWAQIATAAQCELAPPALRTTSPICRALYAGQTPPSSTHSCTDNEAKAQRLPRASHVYPVLLSELGLTAHTMGGDTNNHNSNNNRASSQAGEMRCTAAEKEVVRVGACGAVLDSEPAMRYRSEHCARKDDYDNNITSIVLNDDDDDAAWWPVQHAASTTCPNGTSNNGNSNSTPLYRPPIDALVWLGDAIYADKRMRRGPHLPVGHVVYPIQVVEKMWQTQRRGAEYTAFRETCLPARPRLPPEERATHTSGSDANNNESNHELHTSGGVVYDGEGEEEVDEERSVVGTWDDHDMGTNDGGAEYPLKDITQRFFLRFLNASDEDPRWGRPGVYIFHTLPFHDHHSPVDSNDQAGQEERQASTVRSSSSNSSSEQHNASSTRSSSDIASAAEGVPDAREVAAVVIDALRAVYRHAVCLVLLDGRYFRDPANATRAGDMLGAAQWAWFEALLQHSLSDEDNEGRDHKVPCAVTLIGHGIQFMLDEKPTENWAAFPHSRDRLLGLLRHYHIQRVALLTGDVHMGELGLDSTRRTVHHVLGYPLVEATSSGLTHTTGDLPGARLLLPYVMRSPRRVGLYVEKNFATARLSFDPRQLSPSAVRAMANATTKLRQGTSSSSSSLASLRALRHELQTQLEAIVNVSFTVFAIDQWGKPVLRLRLPLEMLTERQGAQYIDAYAEGSKDGMVYKSVAKHKSEADTLPRHEYTTIPVFAERTAPGSHQLSDIHYVNLSVVHYHSTTPVPFITAFARRMQARSFPDRSVTDSLLRALRWAALLAFCAAVLLVAACVLSCQHRRRSGLQKMSYRRVHGQATAASSTTAMHGGLGSSGALHPTQPSSGAMSSECSSGSGASERAGLGVVPAAATAEREERESSSIAGGAGGRVASSSRAASSSRKRNKME